MAHLALLLKDRGDVASERNGIARRVGGGGQRGQRCQQHDWGGHGFTLTFTNPLVQPHWGGARGGGGGGGGATAGVGLENRTSPGPWCLNQVSVTGTLGRPLLAMLPT